MIGAMLGDIIGSVYEFDRGGKTKDFPLFVKDSVFTDDSVMTVAVAEALMNAGMDAGAIELQKNVVDEMRKWGKRYPDAGYGGGFARWLRSRSPKPYGSWGNGSAMRTSAVGWLYESLERTEEVAMLAAAVTHDHPEGIKGAQAVSGAIWLARSGASKEAIREYAETVHHYDLSRTCDEIRPFYHHVESCQETVPEAITAFLEGNDFEDVIRTAVSLGGDCDTLTCIAGSIAEAYYGVPDSLRGECLKRIGPDMKDVVERFEGMRIKVTG